MNQAEVIALIRVEMVRQNKKWGEQNHSQEKWCTILGEEYGEVCKDALEGNPMGYVNELVEVAAVSIQAILSLCRQTGSAELSP